MAIDWEPAGRLEEPDRLFGRVLTVDRILYNFDGPRIFTFTTKDRSFLAYRADEDFDQFRYVVCPTSKRIVDDLERGLCSVMEAIDQPWTWIIDLNAEMAIQAAWQTPLSSIPNGILPKRSVMLYASLQPLFNVKLLGSTLTRDAVSASVIKRAVDGAYIALKKLSEGVLDAAQPIGRPAKVSRRLFDLPAQRVAISSFEIAFGQPRSENQIVEGNLSELLFNNIQEIGSRLDSALSWATSEHSTTPPLDRLEALSRLVPPQHGAVESVQISGRMLPDPRKVWTLDRTASVKVRKILTEKRVVEEEVRNVSGYTREFDKDKLSFRLREIETDQEFTCFVSEDLYDDVMDVFSGDNAVIVTLRLRRGTSSGEVLEITQMAERQSRSPL